jgi:hypothetical protein
MEKFRKLALTLSCVFLYTVFFRLMYQVYARELQFEIWLLLPLILAIPVTDITVQVYREKQ